MDPLFHECAATGKERSFKLQSSIPSAVLFPATLGAWTWHWSGAPLPCGSPGRWTE